MFARFSPREVFYADILTIAIEGGVNYWADVTDYRHGLNFDGNRTTRETLPGATLVDIADAVDVDKLHIKQSHGTTTITGWDGNTTTTVTLDVNVDTIRRGWNTLLKNKGVADRILRTMRAADRTLDAAYIDAEVADCVLQAGMFGKVILG